MANVKDMTNYFNSMAKGKVNQGEMYVINQRGRGIGNPRRGKAMYPISQTGAGKTASIISPVEQSIVQAESKIRNTRKRKKSVSRSQSVKRRRTGKSRKRKRRRRRTSRRTTRKKTGRRKTKTRRRRHTSTKGVKKTRKLRRKKTSKKRKLIFDALSKRK